MIGKDSEKYLLVRWLFLRLLGFVYLSAFASMATQILGLIGSHGILPAQNYLEVVKSHFGPQAYFFLPSLAWLNSSDTFLSSICWVGTFLSVLVILGIMTAPCLLVLAVLWLSLVTIGGEFTAFQSDGLLIEATIASLLFAPWTVLEPPWQAPLRFLQARAPGKEALWLLRILLFRLMFASGLVKLLSGDTTWRNLTALAYHWQTQPIPTPFAWYLFQLPLWSQKVCTAGVFVAELIAPCLLFAPRRFRLAGASMIFSLQFLIEATGNYTFLNILTMALCIPCLDDDALQHLLPKWLKERIGQSEFIEAKAHWTQRASAMLCCLLIVLSLSRFGATLFGLDILPGPVAQSLQAIERFRIVNRYGMFAVMTTSRPEIIFEGSQDGKTWLSYQFPVKPGDLNEAPSLVAPHMPRLDWRLWFAAMEPWQANPWVASFVERLLEGSPDVIVLLKTNPFPDKPPRFIRTAVYDYRFTSFVERAKSGLWWQRENKREYLPVLSLDDFIRRRP